MAAKNRSQLRTDLRDELKTDPNGRIWLDRELDKFLAQAYSKIQADAQFNFPENQAAPDTLSTVSGTQEYDLPANFGRMKSVTLSNSNFPLDQIELSDLYDRYPNQGQSGTPYLYYLRGAKMGLYPVPDGVSTLARVFSNKFTMPSNDDTAIEYDDDDIAGAMIKFAAYLAWSAPRGNRETALSKLEDYNVLMKPIKLGKIFRQKTYLYKTVRRTGQYYNPRGLN